MKKYITIENYQGCANTTFNHLELTASHNKYRKTMDVEICPVGYHNGIVSKVLDFQKNPLTSGILLARIPMPRKNQKRIDAAQADLNGMAQQIADLWDKRDFDGIKALIVDDEPMNLVVASSLFREYGMIIDTAGSGKESIKKYRADDYDIIFMDHMMPEMDGVEAMKQIKDAARDLGRSAAVVALTANAVSGAREMFIQEGFDGFIAKPINISDFERVVSRVLSGGNAGRGGEKK